MNSVVLRWTLALGLIGLLTLVSNTDVLAAPEFQGPESCQKCHKVDLEVWEKTKHATSMKTVHKTKEAKAIMKALGEKRMKRNDTCTMCHYTMVKSGSKMKAVAGPSCESCHGASSEWKPIHNDYGKDAGGNALKREQEDPAHKVERIEAAAQAGMVWPQRTFDVASNCLICHGLTNETIPADLLSKMMEANHPINPEFELVRYSMGSVRHRFYPPDITVNAEMTPAELSRFFVAGHAASIVAATKVVSKIDHPKYVAAQKARIGAAKAALEAIQGSVPEAAALLQDPSEAKARALVAAIEGKDLSGAVGSLLPAKDSYK